MLYLLLSTYLIFSILLLYSYTVFRHVVKDNAKERAEDAAQNVALSMDNFLYFIGRASHSLSLNLSDNSFDEREVENQLRNFLMAHPVFYAATIECKSDKEPPGQLTRISALHSDQNQHIDKIVIHREREDSATQFMPEEASFSTRNEYAPDGTPSISYTLPLSFQLNKGIHLLQMKGILRLHISNNRMNQRIKDRIKLSDGHVLIVGPENKLIAQSHPSDTEGSQSGQETGYIPTDVSPENIFIQPLKLENWKCVVILRNDLLYKDYHLIYSHIIWIAILGFILIAVAFFFIISRITSPLSQLAESTKEIAAGNFAIKLPYKKGSDEVGKLSRSMQSMADKLTVYFSKMREKERLEGEMKAARDIQKTIIPRIYPAFPQIPTLDIYGRVKQAKGVGGDFFDYVLYKERYLIFAIGDVSGKGFSAALLMAIARTLFRVNANSLNSGHIASKINKELCVGNDSNMFVTMFIGVLDSKTGALRYSNAGHNYPFLKGPNGFLTELKKTHGIPLGMMDTLIYNHDKIQLSHNQSLILYTDGVNESSQGGNNYFGIEGIRKYLQDVSSLESSLGITTGLIDCVESYSAGYEKYADDISVLSVKYIGSSSLTMQISASTEGIRKFQRNLFRYCSDYRMEKKQAMKINLAIEEVLINIVNYAYSGDKDQTIYIQLNYEDSVFKVIIKNAGLAFDITKPPGNEQGEDGVLRIGGWGLFLVRQIMDRIEYTRTGDYNVVNLFKTINTYESRN